MIQLAVMKIFISPHKMAAEENETKTQLTGK